MTYNNSDSKKAEAYSASVESEDVLLSNLAKPSIKSFFLPDAVYDKVTDIEAKTLVEMGIRGLALDVDNTIAKYSEDQPAPEIISWIKKLREEGFSLVIVSNSRKQERVPKISRALDLQYIVRAGKPSRRGFIEATRILDMEPKDVAVVGDQIFTDVLGAKRAGCKAIIVYPRGISENPLFRLRRLIETPFIRIAKKSLKGGV
jgi:HAD superfamily phosphatase (TIGR01668 family)